MDTLQSEKQNIFQDKEEIQKKFIEFIDNDDVDAKNFFKLISNPKYFNNKSEFKNILLIISKITKNHFRSPNFFNKIENILLLLKDQITKSLSNSEIYNIFKGNKRILLILIQNDILIPDMFFTNSIFITKYMKAKYPHYFLPEIKPFITDKVYKQILNDTGYEETQFFELFENERKKGENNAYLCNLIRKDSVEEFVAHVNRKNISLNLPIQTSIFETNSFLLKNSPSLIEYAAFYGSIQIIQYMKYNNVKLKPSLWLYAIHSRNPELIHFLEENQVEQPKNSFKISLLESLKCHHFEITEYIKNNCLIDQQKLADECFCLGIKYLAFNYFPKDEMNEEIFFYLCKNDCFELVKINFKTIETKMNELIILNLFF